jgi:hypothetical protein
MGRCAEAGSLASRTSSQSQRTFDVQSVSYIDEFTFLARQTYMLHVVGHGFGASVMVVGTVIVVVSVVVSVFVRTIVSVVVSVVVEVSVSVSVSVHVVVDQSVEMIDRKMVEVTVSLKHTVVIVVEVFVGGGT